MADNCNSTPVVVYDCQLPLQERVVCAMEFVSVSQASNSLYVSRKVIIRSARNRSRIYSEKLGKEFAIRYKKN